MRTLGFEPMSILGGEGGGPPPPSYRSLLKPPFRVTVRDSGPKRKKGWIPVNSGSWRYLSWLKNRKQSRWSVSFVPALLIDWFVSCWSLAFVPTLRRKNCQTILSLVPLAYFVGTVEPLVRKSRVFVANLSVPKVLKLVWWVALFRCHIYQKTFANLHTISWLIFPDNYSTKRST